MYKYEEIKTVHLEITQRCSASCPMCDRNENGGPVNKHIRNNEQELSLADCEDIFAPEFIRQLKTMYMCGNLGDPIVARDTLEVFRYFRKHNPDIWLSMNTMAGAKQPDWWAELAEVFGHKGAVIFSVDGLENTNQLYRQGVVWANVERNMQAFIAAGGRARWDYLVFEHNECDVERAEQLAAEWGVEKFIKKKSGRFVTTQSQAKETHQAKNRRGEDTTTLAKPRTAEYQNLALLKQQEIEKTYGSMMEYYNRANIKCKVAGDEKNIFVTAEGLVLPCCWTAGRMYKWWHTDPKVEQIWDFIDEVGGKDSINAKLFGIQGVFDSGIMQNIQASWSKKSIAEGKLGVCAMKCGTEFDPFAAQFE
jgi:MoaA/NifB/PqqE/SkfB family radical SAM enzyme